jgi:hypothetical protein
MSVTKNILYLPGTKHRVHNDVSAVLNLRSREDAGRDDLHILGDLHFKSFEILVVLKIKHRETGLDFGCTLGRCDACSFDHLCGLELAELSVKYRVRPLEQLVLVLSRRSVDMQQYIWEQAIEYHLPV